MTLADQYWAILVLVILGMLWGYFLFRTIRYRPYGSKLLRFLTFLVLFLGCLAVFLFLRGIFDLVALIFPIAWAYFDDYLSNMSGPRRIIAVMRSHSPFGKAMVKELRASAEELIPSVSLEVLSPEQDENVNQQIICLEEAISKRPDVIVLMPAAHEEHLIPSVLKAMKRGIPIVTVDRRLSRTEFIKEGITPPLHIASDFQLGGRLAADTMMKNLKRSGNVAIISGPKHSEVSELRRLAFAGEIIEHAPILRIVFCRYSNWGAEEGTAIMDELLKGGEKIHGIFCCNDSLAIGALKTIREQKTSKGIIIIGFDGIPEMRDKVFSGEVGATIDVDIESQAKTVVREVEKILRERKRYLRIHPGQILVRPRVLTREVALRNAIHKELD